MTDFLTEKRQQIADRLKELKPLVDEYNRLEAAASALGKLGASAPTTTPPAATVQAAAHEPACKPALTATESTAVPPRAAT